MSRISHTKITQQDVKNVRLTLVWGFVLILLAGFLLISCGNTNGKGKERETKSPTPSPSSTVPGQTQESPGDGRAR